MQLPGSVLLRDVWVMGQRGILELGVGPSHFTESKDHQVMYPTGSGYRKLCLGCSAKRHKVPYSHKSTRLDANHWLGQHGIRKAQHRLLPGCLEACVCVWDSGRLFYLLSLVTGIQFPGTRDAMADCIFQNVYNNTSYLSCSSRT